MKLEISGTSRCQSGWISEVKKVLLVFMALGSSLFADVYNLKQVSITKDIHCVIGDLNPPNKRE